MAIYRLLDDNTSLFPPPHFAEPEGLLAVGGDLSPDRILNAYRQGIFPWYEEGQPILWWSPDPRLILEPHLLKISKSMRKVIKKNIFEIKMDSAFSEVIHECAVTRLKHDKGTWITNDMERSYLNLHEMGYAHSIESWSKGELVGGLYGLFLGKCFFGESMFMKKTDASKAAFIALVEKLKEWEVKLIDCQVKTNHLMSLGAFEITRKEFLSRLQIALQYQTIPQKWSHL